MRLEAGTRAAVPVIFLVCLGVLTGTTLGIGSSFQSILQQVTEEKLEELRVQKDLMENHFNPALEEVGKLPNKPRESLQILYDAAKNSPVKDTIDNTLIENLKSVLENSKLDPSLSPQLLSAWGEKIQQEIQQSLRKCHYSYLYGSLLSEWLEVDERKQRQNSTKTSSDKIKQEKVDATKVIQAIMYSEPDFNAEKFKKFLTDEFFNYDNNVEVENLVKQIRKEASEFLNVEHTRVSSSDVQHCIKGLLSEELLSPGKKVALKELSQNSDTLTEVASLLTNRLKNIDRWDWPNGTVSAPVDIRRGLGGEYKAYLNEDMITSLFLQYVGVQWAAFFKDRYKRIYNSKMWKRVHYNHGSIEWERQRFHEDAFLSSLPDSLELQENKNKLEYVKIQSSQSHKFMASTPASFMESSDYEEEEEILPQAVSGSFGPSNANKHFSRPRPRPTPRPKPDIDFRQSFLHVLSTEIRLHQVISPDKPLHVVQADLKEFGPTLNHEAALMAMEQFGVSNQWLTFFKKFLQPNIRFFDADEPKKVVRGAPTSHALSSLFGETLLFVLETVVNRNCNGMRIYRISDEFWFWSKGDDVVQAWKLLNDYGNMVGLSVNENRSGSVKILGENSVDSKSPSIPGPAPLPQRTIHWGYLELHSSGIFKIDQNSTTKFLDEMKGLLGKAECTLEWINIFNKYMVFFVRNFGKGALVFGRQHLDQIIESLRMIYSGIFGSLEASPVTALKERFQTLPEADVLDAWVYWPLEMGGLGLTNPFIATMALRESYEKINDEDGFRKLPAQDRIFWEELKANHERNYGPVLHDGPPGETGRVYQQQQQYTKYQPVVYQPGPPKLLTREEYVKTRETELSHWYQRYLRLLERPGPASPTMPNTFWSLGSLIPTEELAKNYFMWLYNYYETQLVLHFGTSKFINYELLPMSRIANIQKAKLDY